MIKVDGEEVKIEYFPDGTQRLNYFPKFYKKRNEIVFSWKYKSDEELVTLIFLVNHLRDAGFTGDFILDLDFVPNGRMDRTYNDWEVFTLKYFCKIINDLNFAKVFILDPHSNVTPALINNVDVRDVSHYIYLSLLKINEDVVIYYPDYSAMKKYSAIIPGIKYVYGNKKRDWDTGKILGIEIVNDYHIDLADKTILMIDDLISYGGSMYYGAMKLKELGVGKIYAYASHTENSVLDREKGTLIKLLENGTVKGIFTTDSLYSGNHKKITILDIYNENNLNDLEVE